MRRNLPTFALCVLTLGTALSARADNALPPDGREVQHVLLISVDGMHALDLANYVASHPASTLASLGRHGVTYTNNSTTTPSDSFPGLASLVTGGSPVTAGFWYDDAYNRALSPPQATDGLGNRAAHAPTPWART